MEIYQPSANWKALSEKLIKESKGRKRAYQPKVSNSQNALKTMNSTSDVRPDAEVGKYVAIDCEMVGVGPSGSESALARVSIVNFHGEVILDKFCRPQERVTDFRTHISGISPSCLKEAEYFHSVQKQVSDIIKGRVLVGHALDNDLRALLLDHPRGMIRDTCRYKPYRVKYAYGRSPSLKKLAKEILNVDIQCGSHSSVEDAKIAMKLFKNIKLEWESRILKKSKKK
jgi:RNA exonuclease 4